MKLGAFFCLQCFPTKMLTLLRASSTEDFCKSVNIPLHDGNHATTSIKPTWGTISRLSSKVVLDTEKEGSNSRIFVMLLFFVLSVSVFVSFFFALERSFPPPALRQCIYKRLYFYLNLISSFPGRFILRDQGLDFIDRVKKIA